MTKPARETAATLVIAVDGPAASGKGTLAKRLAAWYHLAHLDTGLLYRGVAGMMLDAEHDLHDAALAEQAASRFDPATLDEDRLRGRDMGEAASVIAAMPGVRAALVDLQREFSRKGRGAVLDGRDIGTVICPEATAKLFVTASPEVRAARRHKELLARGETVLLDDIVTDIRRRDARDSGRRDAPLKAAGDAVIVDTSALTIDESLEAAIRIVERARLGAAKRH